MMRFIRSAWVIARRDFTATVLSKAFIFFLLGPLFPLLFGGVFAGIGTNVASQAKRPVVAVIAPKAEFDRLQAARGRLAQAVGEDPLVELVNYPPEPDRSAQQKRLLATRQPPVRAVLSGGLDRPKLVGALAADPGTAGQLQLLVAAARTSDSAEPELEVTNVAASSGTIVRDRALTGQIAQVILFLLTLMLSTMVLSQLIEEKSNKVIEVLAAAVPVDAIFLGKLLAMLAASLAGIAVWAAVGAAALEIFAPNGLGALPPPAVGWPLFVLFGVIYFAMSYLLLGSIFLGIGAHASSAREVQTLSMPVTMAQVVIFAIASIAIGNPNGKGALGAMFFPLSSPYVMIARAGELPDLWIHGLAVVWQLLWVALFLRIASSIFRKNVLKSGPSRASRRKVARG